MIIANAAEMRAFGQQLATTLMPGDWLAIDGPLGAGKTVLCAGILSGLGYAGEVASPSYSIVHIYEPPELSIAVLHADLYRVEDVAELEELGLHDGQDNRIALVEWAERGGTDYARPSHHIRIEPKQGDYRELIMKTNK